MTSLNLPSVAQLIQNGEPLFGVFTKVSHVNYLDYHSFLLSGKAVSQWRKKMRANQFTFLQVNIPPYRICVAVGTIQWATTAFCYIFNDNTQAYAVSDALLPLTHHCQFNQSPYQHRIAFSHKKLQVQIEFSPALLTLAINCDILRLSAHLPRFSPHEPLALCSPTGKTGWTFTQKEPFAEVSGEFVIKNSTKTQDFTENTPIKFSHAIATLDWTLGYLRRMTNWHWSCINTRLPSGEQVSVNLAMGVNETGMSENACWIDGKIYYLPPVLFKKPKANTILEKWQIFHQNLGYSAVQVNLTFTPIRCYQKNDRFYLIDSIFEQWLGVYQGEIVLGDRQIILDNVIGLAEDHYALW